MLLFFVVLLNLMIVHADKAESRLEVRNYIAIADQIQITMKDIARFEALNPVDEKNLSEIVVTNAPKLGEKKSITSRELITLLKSKSENLKGWNGSKIKMQIPTTVRIENVGASIDENKLKSDLLAAWQKMCADCQFNIKQIQTPKIDPKHQNLAWQLKAVSLPRSSFSTAIEILGEEGHANPMYWVNGSVEMLKKVPVATRAIYFAERIELGDFKWEWRDVSLAQDGIPLAGELAGKRLRGSVRAGDILWRASIEKEKALTRGESVRVLVGEPTWQVSLTALAEQDGFIGDTVKVKNPKTSKILSGVVTAKGEVSVQ